MVPDSVADPLGYYKNNTVNSRALIECAVKGGVKHFIFSSTAAVYGNPARVPVTEDDPLMPMSPYGSSKLMTEIMLRDAGIAHGLGHVILRYFNVAGADPELRTGQSTKGATHLIKVAVETALGRRAKMDVFGTDYPTPDGTCVRDYIHVSDLVRRASRRAALSARRRRLDHGQLRLWPRLFGARGDRHREARLRRRFPCRSFGRAGPGDPAQIVASSDRARAVLGWKPPHDDLSTIVGHALGWERKLMLRNRHRNREPRLFPFLENGLGGERKGLGGGRNGRPSVTLGAPKAPVLSGGGAASQQCYYFCPLATPPRGGWGCFFSKTRRRTGGSPPRLWC